MFKILFIFLISINAFTSPYYKVGVIDTGFKDKIKTPICLGGSIKLVKDQTVVHGEVVASVIQDTLDKHKINFCFVDIQAVKAKNQSIEEIEDMVEYVERNLNLDYLNVSYGGWYKSEKECKLYDRIRQKGTKVFFAAGNNSANLDVECNFFPACCNKNNVIVGNLESNGKVNKTSNYGKRVNVWRVGTNIWFNGTPHTGTSFAAPQALADYIVHENSKTSGMVCQ